MKLKIKLDLSLIVLTFFILLKRNENQDKCSYVCARDFFNRKITKKIQMYIKMHSIMLMLNNYDV